MCQDYLSLLEQLATPLISTHHITVAGDATEFLFCLKKSLQSFETSINNIIVATVLWTVYCQNNDINCPPSLRKFMPVGLIIYALNPLPYILLFID